MENTIPQNSVSERKKTAILGAIVADAASLGLHWIYDANRIKEVGGNAPEFLEPDQLNYEGVSSYYAHPNKKPGDNTHYGDQCLTLLESLEATDGKWSPSDYQRRFFEKFGPNGNYDGYLDSATKDTIARIQESEQFDDSNFTPYGSQDTQAPAISKLPALVGQFAGDSELLQKVETAIRVTNDNDESVRYGTFAAKALESVILGNEINQSMIQAANSSAEDVRQKIGEALGMEETNPAKVSEALGMACNLFQALPVSANILANKKSFTEGVRANIFAGGDNAGRAIFVGAILGAAYGVGGDRGIPQDWIEKLTAKGTIDRALDKILSPFDLE